MKKNYINFINYLGSHLFCVSVALTMARCGASAARARAAAPRNKGTAREGRVRRCMGIGMLLGG